MPKQQSARSRELDRPSLPSARSSYLGPGKIGADFFGTGTVTSRRSPLLFTTLSEMLSDAAAMLLATACAVSTGLPAASTMTSPATIPFS